MAKFWINSTYGFQCMCLTCTHMSYYYSALFIKESYFSNPLNIVCVKMYEDKASHIILEHAHDDISLNSSLRKCDPLVTVLSFNIIYN